MFNTKEIAYIILITIILAFSITLMKTSTMFGYIALSMLIIILVNVVAKKMMSFYLDSQIKIRLWEWQRYGFKPSAYFKKPFPIGAFLPVIIAILTLGNIKWLASLVFDVKAKTHRAAKRFGLYSYSEMTEYHIGLIAAAGVVANLLMAVIGYLIGFPEKMQFATLNIYYAFYNMLPLSDLDGNKIFFGSIILWSFLAALTLVGLFYALFLI